MNEVNDILLIGDYTNRDITIDSNGSLLIKVQTQKETEISLNFTIKNDVDFRCLIFNDSNNKLTINDNYHIGENSKVVIAYSLLNDAEVICNSAYYLDGIYSDLHILSAIIGNCSKKLNQFTHHYANNSKALIDNYGVLLQNGQCNMVVKNKIYKNITNCNTRQNNRLLNFSDNAKGKILPILYIDNNEVAASHGCSIGQVDQQQIFYLTSRGLSYSDAVKLITLGYLLPVTEIIDNQEVNQLLKAEIEKKVDLSC